MNMQRILWASLAGACLALAGCHAADSDDEGDAPATHDAAAADAPLSPAEIQALGIATTPAKAARSAPEISGFGVVIAHEAIQQAVAELQTATAAVRQSRAAADRLNQLASTPGAMSADATEAATRQATADLATLEVARQHLSSLLGDNASWRDPDDNSQLLALARGEQRLVRVTFPLTLLGSQVPTSVRVARIDAAQGGRSWKSAQVWRAPADASVPGMSLFAVIANRDLQEGERVLAWTAVGDAEPGVVIPAAAAVTSAGQFYCFVERAPGQYERVEFSPDRAAGDGYFVTQGIAAGDQVVTSGAAHLLAREINPSTEADE
jgi:hypothetical protein